jgi:hypothetical protein
MRTSERGDMQCPWKWHQAWVRKLTSNRAPTWAWFGTAIHKAMEVRYPIGTKRGHMADTLDAFDAAMGKELRKIYTGGQEVDDEEVHDAGLLGRAMLIGYEKRWGLDQEWQVIHSEQPFQIDVHDPITGELIVIYCGTFDMIVYNRKTKRFYVVDHKTRRSFPATWTFLDLNKQAGSYLWVAPEVLEHMGIFKKGKPNHYLSGIIFNMLRKAMPDTRPLNAEGLACNLPKKADFIQALHGVGIMGADNKALDKVPMDRLQELAHHAKLTVYGEASAKQPSPLFARYTSTRTIEERVRQAQHVANEARIMHLLRTKQLPITKQPSEDCVRCTFFDMCQLDEQDPAQGREYAASVMHRRDPYKDHRLAMKRNGIELTVASR